jgi:single-strand DNA-binding protein
MSGSVNKVIIVGNLVKEIECRNTSDGREVVNLVIATNESWKGKDGERKEKTEFHRVTIFNEGLVKIAKQYLKKGNKLYCSGQLQTRKWQQDGQDRYSTEIVLQGYNCELTMLEAPKKEPSQHDKDKQNGYAPDDLDQSIPF